MSKREEQQEQLADELMQRMAQHAPVSQHRKKTPGGFMQWLVIWGEHISCEGATRYAAVMGIMDQLLSAAGLVDPRTAWVTQADDPPEDAAPLTELKEGSLDVGDDQASTHDNDPA